MEHVRHDKSYEVPYWERGRLFYASCKNNHRWVSDGLEPFYCSECGGETKWLEEIPRDEILNMYYERYRR